MVPGAGWAQTAQLFVTLLPSTVMCCTDCHNIASLINTTFNCAVSVIQGRLVFKVDSDIRVESENIQFPFIAYICRLSLQIY